MSNPKFGDVYYVRSAPTVGSEQRGGRPAIIVSNNIGNQRSDIVEVVYLTTAPKADLPTHVKIPAQGRIQDSTALCEQIDTVSQTRLATWVGSLDATLMKQIQAAMMVSLSMAPDIAYGCSNIELRERIRELEVYLAVQEGILQQVLNLSESTRRGRNEHPVS